MNAFEKMKQEAKEKLNEVRCPVCKGAGKCNDAEPYGMTMNEWICIQCDGSGLRPIKKNNNK